jgi:hypothetical protein
MIMDRFTHDLETAELTGGECAEFARLVGDLCECPEQRRMSAFLGSVARPQAADVCDYVGRRMGRLWRNSL